MEENQRVRFAVIGTNAITREFLEGCEAVSGLELVGVYSRSMERAEAFAAEYGAERCYDSLTGLAGDAGVDAVYIASPNCCHCQQALLMMEAGKHVLCEKPIASNSGELEAMLECAKRQRVVLLEAMRPVFDPGFEAVAENLPKIGIVRHATFVYCQYSSRYDKYKTGIVENAFRREMSNGALMDIGIYCVHPMVRLFGMPGRISAHGVLLKDSIDGAGTITAEYADMLGEMIYSKISGSSLPSQIQGEDGNMIIREIMDTREILIEKRNGEAETIRIEKERNNMYYEAKEWMRLIGIRGDGSFYNNSSVLALKVMDEARRQMEYLFPADAR